MLGGEGGEYQPPHTEQQPTGENNLPAAGGEDHPDAHVRSSMEAFLRDLEKRQAVTLAKTQEAERSLQELLTKADGHQDGEDIWEKDRVALMSRQQELAPVLLEPVLGSSETPTGNLRVHNAVLDLSTRAIRVDCVGGKDVADAKQAAALQREGHDSGRGIKDGISFTVAADSKTPLSKSVSFTRNAVGMGMTQNLHSLAISEDSLKQREISDDYRGQAISNEKARAVSDLHAMEHGVAYLETSGVGRHARITTLHDQPSEQHYRGDEIAIQIDEKTTVKLSDASAEQLQQAEDVIAALRTKFPPESNPQSGLLPYLDEMTDAIAKRTSQLEETARRTGAEVRLQTKRVAERQHKEAEEAERHRPVLDLAVSYLRQGSSTRHRFFPHGSREEDAVREKEAREYLEKAFKAYDVFSEIDSEGNAFTQQALYDKRFTDNRPEIGADLPVELLQLAKFYSDKLRTPGEQGELPTRVVFLQDGRDPYKGVKPGEKVLLVVDTTRVSGPKQEQMKFHKEEHIDLTKRKGRFFSRKKDVPERDRPDVLILHADSPFASRSLRRFDIDGYDSLLIADRFGDSQPIPKGMTFDDDYIPGGVESNLIETGKIRFDSDKAEPGWQGHDAGYSTDPKVVIFPGAKLFDKRKPFGATEKDEPDKDFLRRVTEDL